MSSVGPTALEAQPGASFVVVALRAYFGMARLPFICATCVHPLSWVHDTNMVIVGYVL